MSVTREHLEHLCKLAALNLTDEQMTRFAPQIDSIVDLVSKLESLDVDNYISQTSDSIQSHTNDGLVTDSFDLLSNIKHPVAGNMPSVSFSTRGEG